MERYGHVNFCEDIRREVGGQRSLIGCYDASMSIPEKLPYIVPRLCLDISIYMIKTKKVENLEVEIYLPGGDDAPFKIIKAQRNEKVWDGSTEREDGTPMNVKNRMILSFTGLRIETDGAIRVFANFDGDKMRIGGLRIRSIPEDEQAKR